MSILETVLKSRVIKGCFTIDQAAFILFDGDFAEPYLTNFDAAITAAANIPDYEYMQDELAILTVDVETKMEDIRSAFKHMRPFIEKAYPNQKQVWNSFGYDNYGADRNSQTKIGNFIFKLHLAAVKRSAELILVGYPQVDIDNLQSLHTNLIKAQETQEAYKLEIKDSTNDRMEAMNAMWEFVQHICRVGKIIFEDDYGKYQQYVMYPASSGGSDEFKAKVPANGTVVILDKHITPSTVFTLKNTGNTDLLFCLGDLNNPCAAGTQVDAGGSTQITAQDMGSGTMLKCTNLSTTEEGEYDVKVV